MCWLIPQWWPRFLPCHSLHSCYELHDFLQQARSVCTLSFSETGTSACFFSLRNWICYNKFCSSSPTLFLLPYSVIIGWETTSSLAYLSIRMYAISLGRYFSFVFIVIFSIIFLLLRWRVGTERAKVPVCNQTQNFLMAFHIIVLCIFSQWHFLFTETETLEFARFYVRWFCYALRTGFYTWAMPAAFLLNCRKGDYCEHWTLL